jgi:hypothetical protein
LRGSEGIPPFFLPGAHWGSFAKPMALSADTAITEHNTVCVKDNTKNQCNHQFSSPLNHSRNEDEGSTRLSSNEREGALYSNIDNTGMVNNR